MSMYDALALEYADDRLRDADLSPAARREHEAIQNADRDYQEDRRLLDTLLNAVNGNTELSDEGRRRRREDALREWDETADRLLSSLEARAARLVPDAVRQLTVPPLHRDPATAQARLAAAERHAMMMLEHVPVAQLQDRMTAYATSATYNDVSYALSATPFGRMYLESRGVLGAGGDEWEERRLEALRPRLSDTGQRALDDLPSLRQIAQLPTNLRGMHDRNRMRYGLRRS